MHSTREVTIRSDDKVWFDSDLRRESRKRDRLRQIFFRPDSAIDDGFKPLIVW